MKEPVAPRVTSRARIGIVPPAGTPESPWNQRLLFAKSKSGPDKIAKHHENAVVVLRYHPMWRGCLQFDEHSFRVLVTGAPWHESDSPSGHSGDTLEWTDADSMRLSSWLRREIALELSVTDCDRAVTIAAEANTCHPFRDYLESLVWDTVERLPYWCADYLGVAPSVYVAHVGRWWIVSAAARTFHPGCKADHVLILEGEQGTRKSTALRTLAGSRWFSDTPIDIGSKDAYLALQGRVIVELAELDSLKRSDADRAKVFFSSPVDQYRPPYGKRTVTVPRGCIFAGTVNHANYLTDETGGRRYWPIRCGDINLAQIASARDQLWAEAVVRYRRGERWWPEGADEFAMCTEQQAPRTESEPWEDIISAWLVTHPGQVTICEVLEGACKLTAKDIHRQSQMRAARVLLDCGYVREREAMKDNNGKRPWFYRRKESR